MPARNHPLTPENTFKLTSSIAEYHAKALDQIGSLYYSGESYDDYYYGKGSTYPDVNGSIGILFEQASARGHMQETENGPLTFPFAIRNQFITSLSTMEASKELRVELLEHQKNFYSSAINESSEDPITAYILKSEDKGRLYHFLKMVRMHKINVYQLNNEVTVGDKKYNPQESFVIPLGQDQYRLIKAMFEKTNQFPRQSVLRCFRLDSSFGL